MLMPRGEGEAAYKLAREVTAFAATIALIVRSLRTGKAEKKGEELPSLSVTPRSLPILPPVLSRGERTFTDSLRTSPLSNLWPGKTDSFFKEKAFYAEIL